MSDESKTISNFEEMVQQFKDMAELQTYCNAQYKTIIELNRQITVLKAEKTSIEKIVTHVPNIVEFQSFSISPEEQICLKQLHDLNFASKTRELTLEEARKTEIYSKILATLKNTPKDIDAKSKSLSNEELLQLAGTEKV